MSVLGAKNADELASRSDREAALQRVREVVEIRIGRRRTA
jgi:hypothetical protein